jgi:eukaryotic-like serine/threonine-protein kinase
MTAAADRNLLFGLLALQTGMIDQAALVAAFHTWTRDEGPSMAHILLAQGAIDDGERGALEVLAAKHLERHGEDIGKSLTAVPAPSSLVTELVAIGDADVDVTLGYVAGSGSNPTDGDAGRDGTTTASMGGTAGDGRRFRVLRPHARGGLGEVFVALDAELNREVALKQILDDPTSRTRFILEAEITGGLEHPGIVPVYGLGSHGNGRPYYAMRFVRGDSLKDAITAFHTDTEREADPGRRSLALRELLRRFTDVCNAIQYSHTRGVIHRDIKPANVIVGKHGETLVVDWGLAKAMGKAEPGTASDERTLMPSSATGSAETLPGSSMGTPSYMSPEQAAGDLDRLGPRSDIYSLGVSLYCLLTGKPPFGGDDVEAVLRAVRKGDFPPPRSLDPTLDRALEAVCLKAMAVKPEDRYESPRALADDVERWAADEPVSAWREPLARRSRRWPRRNRTAVTAGAVVVLAALFGTAAVLAVQTRANGTLKKVNAYLKASNDRERARFLLSMEAIKMFHSGVSDDVLLKRTEFVVLRNKLLRGALSFYGRLEKLLETQADRGSQEDLAGVYVEVGDLTRTIGSRDEALDACLRALAIRQKLANGSPAADGSNAKVAQALERVGSLQDNLGRAEEARAANERALAIMAPLIEGGPDRTDYLQIAVDCHIALAIIHHRANRMADSMAQVVQGRKICEHVVALDPARGEARTDLANCVNNIGVLLQNEGRNHEARASFDRALAIREGLVRDDPRNNSGRNAVGRSLNSIGVLLIDVERPAEAVPFLERGRDLREALLREFPNEITYKSELILCLINLGSAFANSGRPEAARAAFARAIEVVEPLAAENPNVISFQHDLALALHHQASMETDLDRLPEAMALADRSRASEAKVVAANPGESDFHRGILAKIDQTIASNRLAAGRPADAVAAGQRVIETCRSLHDEYPNEERWQASLASGRVGLGKAYLALGRLADAKRFATEGLAGCRALADTHRGDSSLRMDMANAAGDLAMIEAAGSDQAAGSKLIVEGLARLG